MALLQNSNAVTPVSGFELKSGRFDRNSASYLSRSNLSGGSTTKVLRVGGLSVLVYLLTKECGALTKVAPV